MPTADPMMADRVFLLRSFFFKKKLQFRKVSTCKNFPFLCHPSSSSHSFEPSSWVFLLILSHFLQKHADFCSEPPPGCCLPPHISGCLCGLSPMAGKTVFALLIIPLFRMAAVGHFFPTSTTLGFGLFFLGQQPKCPLSLYLKAYLF